MILSENIHDDWIRKSPYLELLYSFIKALFRAPKSSKDEGGIDPQRRLFLCLIADFWLGNTMVIKKEFNNARAFGGRRESDGDEEESGAMELRTLDNATSVDITDLTLQVSWVNRNERKFYRFLTCFYSLFERSFLLARLACKFLSQAFFVLV